MGLCKVLDHMLLQNQELRARLTEIEALAIAVASGRSALSLYLCVRGVELLESLETQITWEERYLLPAIREFYGPDQAAHAEAEQRAQRERLRCQLEEITDRTRPPLFLAYRLRDLAAMVRNELEEEERFLRSGSARDDDLVARIETG